MVPVLIALFLVLAGCGAQTIYKGGREGVSLISVRVASRDEVIKVCSAVGSPDNVLACAMFTNVINLPSCHIETASTELEVIVHEACHCLAKALKIVPDPCHNEDHGYISIQ